MNPPLSADGRRPSRDSLAGNASASRETSSSEPVQSLEPKDSLKLDALSPSVDEGLSPNYSILRHEKGAIITLLFYLPFLVTPWILTAILSRRPLNQMSYVDHSLNFNVHDLAQLDKANNAVRVLSSIAAVLAIPVITSLLVQAVVVFTQASSASGRALSLQQMIALANNSWSSALFWFEGTLSGGKQIEGRIQRPHAYIARLGPRSAALSRSLVAALALVVLVSVQPPLQQLLVTSETLTIPTCMDNPAADYTYTCPGFDPLTANPATSATFLALDVNPKDLFAPMFDMYSDPVADDLANFDPKDLQPYMWEEDWRLGLENALASTLSPYTGANFGSHSPYTSFPIYVASLPYRTATGVLPSAALRLNSSVECSAKNRSDFPAQCPGDLPFTAFYGNQSGLNVRVCVPGNYSRSPWTSLPARSDISEELWLDSYLAWPWQALPPFETHGFNANITVHCVLNSTAGYFELPNEYNGNMAGELLATQPNLTTPYPVYGAASIGSGGAISPCFGGPDLCIQAPGPLTISALAIFGNSSWFGNAALAAENGSTSSLFTLQDFCKTEKLPFLKADIFLGQIFSYDRSFCNVTKFLFPNSTDEQQIMDINTIVYEWIYGFANNTIITQEALLISSFFANKALLQQTVHAYGGVPVFTSPGTTISKPYISETGLIVISVLIGLQVILLVCLATYSSLNPIWTSSLDALAMMRLGSKLTTDQLPMPRPWTRTDVEPFDHLDGSVRFEPSLTGGQIEPTLGEGMTSRDVRRMKLPYGRPSAFVHGRT